jgi:hypothetical protein
MTRKEAARLGRLARARALSPARRSAIAALGFAALVEKRFGGDRRAAVVWLVAAGLAAQDRALSESLRSLGGSGAIVPLADDPGPMPPPATPEDLHQGEAKELPFESPRGETPMSEPTPAAVVVAQTLATATAPHGGECHA